MSMNTVEDIIKTNPPISNKTIKTFNVKPVNP